VHPATADAPQPRLELRLRDGPDGWRSGVPYADDRGQVRAGMPGNRRVEEVDERGRPGTTERPVRAQGCARPHSQRQRLDFTATPAREWLERVGTPSPKDPGCQQDHPLGRW